MIRKALSQLRDGLGETEHLSQYRLVADVDTIFLLKADEAIDLVKRRGDLVIHEFVEVLAPYYHDGRQVPDLRTPRKYLAIDPGIRGGEPVIAGTRIPSAEVAARVRDGIAPAKISGFYPGVSAAAALDAEDFADYVDSYQPQASDAA